LTLKICDLIYFEKTYRISVDI